MPEETTAQKEGSESTPHGPESNPPAAPRKRPWWKQKPVLPLLLLFTCLACLALAFFAYPRRAPVEGVTGATVQITGSSQYVDDHIQIIDYGVWQVRPGVAHVEVDVQLGGPPYPNGGYTYLPPGASADITFYAGTKVLNCSPHCSTPNIKVGDASPTFQVQGAPPTATANFYIRARSYEVAANGATAAVGFPEVDSSGTHPAALELQYTNFPSASRYDWSSSPGGDFSKTLGAIWSETVLPSNPLFGAVASPRVATGVNPAAQQHDSNLTLAVGVLFGIGGSALVAAVQEALRD
jgi:hypothetical protein